MGFVEEHNLGEVYAAETGFIIHREPDTVRAPDAAFVRIGRIAEQDEAGFFDGAPDLAVEVVSPNDSAPDVEAKVEDFLSAGTQQVWIVHPTTETITLYYADGRGVRFGKQETVEGAELLPGFSLPLAEIFK